MTFRVVITSEARDQLLAIDTWWAANRPSAPDLVWRELDEAIQGLEQFPTSANDYPAMPGHRRLLLRRTGFHVYYVIDEPMREVTIVAVWGARRGHGPSFR